MILNADARRLPVADESVDCIVTSPPYNAGIDYGEVSDVLPWEEYRDLAAGSCREMCRVVRPGGRVWANVMRTIPEVLTNGTHRNGPGAKGGHLVARVDLARLWGSALEVAGLEYRDTVVWVQDSHDGACSWGSWESPAGPNLRGDHEVVLLFHKPPWRRVAPRGFEDWRDKLGGWETLCRNVWKIQPAARNGHPAPFPEQLAARAIRLSTWPGEVVLDSFSGEGTTVKAAERLGRVGIGSDLSAAYCELAQARTAQGVLL